MSNITTQNNIAYAIDNLEYISQGVIISNSYALDCSKASKVSGFNISYSQPANTKIFLMFKTGNFWGVLKSDGSFSNVQKDTPDFAVLEKKGNTIADLLALSNIPAFAGQYVYTAIGLYSEDPDNSLPRVKFSVKCSASSRALTSEILSPVYAFENSKVIRFTPQFSTAGNSSVKIFAQITDPNGNISEFLPLDDISGKNISALQFKAVMSVNDIDSANYAFLENVKCVYADISSSLSNSLNGEIFSNTLNWYMPVKECRLTIKHKPLELSKIRAFVSLRNAPSVVKNEILGIGTGAKKVFQLAHTQNINYQSFKIFHDGVQVFTDFELNSRVGRVSVTAPEGVIISCSYEYNYGLENWRELSSSSVISFDDYDATEFRGYFSENNCTVAALKILLEMTSGKISNEALGSGNGKSRTFKLTHRVNDGNITVYANGSKLDAKNFMLLDDPQYISIAASNGAKLTASYDWVSDTPVIYQIAAVFSE